MALKGKSSGHQPRMAATSLGVGVTGGLMEEPLVLPRAGGPKRAGEHVPPTHSYGVSWPLTGGSVGGSCGLILE